MGFNWLRKRALANEQTEIPGTTYTAPEIPMMNQPPVSTSGPPESAAPTQKPATTPISAAKTAVPAVSTSNDSTAKVDPKSGAAGLKAFTDIVATESRFGEAGIGNTGLIDAYNAGLNGVDLSRKTKDDAAAGLYIDQLWAMYDAGKQDAKVAEERENEEKMSNNVETAQHKTVDNPENIGYPNNATSGNDSNNNAAADEYVPDMGAVTSKPSTESGSSTSGDKSFINRQWDQDYNYIMDMMFINGAGNSPDPTVQMAYQYFMNPENNVKQIPKEMIRIYEDYVKTIYGFNGDRSHKIVAGASLNDSYNERMENIKKRNSEIINPAEKVHVFPVEGGNFKIVKNNLTDYPNYPSGNYQWRH